MIIVASANGDVGMGAGMDVLRSGGSALDAVEAACRVVEDNLDDHSVGTGGYPNLLGEVELDASLMEGTTRRAGAVAALKGYAHPISVARAVMDHLPQHLLLCGDGAARFAAEQGFPRHDLLTPEAAEAFRRHSVLLHGEEYTFDAKTHGTVNFLALDDAGHMASAVSTSGWAFKYPGRVGDSPLIGAGNYCDDRFGACACTGLGEWATRASTARTVVLAMQFGMDLEAACRFAFHDLAALPVPPPTDPVMNLVALDAAGHHTAYATAPDRTYLWQTGDMASYESSPRVLLPASDRPPQS